MSRPKQTHAPQQTAAYSILVGAGKQGRRHGEAEGLCCFEIDRQFKFGGLLYRHFRRQRCLQDAIDIDAA
jgi:hypothetical protein